MSNITVIDTKAGNLFSLQSALSKIGKSVVIAQTPAQVKGDQIVIPGQGRFGTVIDHLRSQGWLEYLNQWRQDNKTILGICVGMQIMFESSDEDSTAEGLGWFEGRAERLNFPKKPMVGWAPLVTRSLPEGAAYFVNSYAIRESGSCIAQANYGETFCAAVNDNKVTGFQFHPEKSSQYGNQLLQKCLG